MKKTPKSISVPTKTELRAATPVTPPLPFPKLEEGEVLAVLYTNLGVIIDHISGHKIIVLGRKEGFFSPVCSTAWLSRY